MSLLSDPLKAFVKVCETGTVMKTAAALGLTQTGITQRVRTLEKTLGVTLFLRSRSGMKKTREAEELYRYCQSVLRLEAESLPFLKSEASSRPIPISICGPTSLMRARIVPKLSQYMKSRPQALIHINLDDFEDRVKKLKNGQVDFAFIRDQDVPDEMASKPLRPQRFLLVGPRAWKDHSIEDVAAKRRIIDFDPRDDMTFRYLKKHKLADFAQADRHFVNSIECLLQLVEEAHGYSVLDESFIEHFVGRRKIAILNEGKSIENRMALCWMHRTVYPTAFTELIESIV